MNNQKLKICFECKHFNRNMQYPRCNAISTVNLVTGSIQKTDCHPERIAGTKCGPEGKLFERGKA